MTGSTGAIGWRPTPEVVARARITWPMRGVIVRRVVRAAGEIG